MTNMPPKPPAVLIVEDEPLIRMEAVYMMEDAGFRTFDAASAQDALALFDAHDDIGILFTDINMPGSMDGLQLAKIVHERRPEVSIMIASGAFDVEKLDLPKGACFFPKPYVTHQIMQALAQISGTAGR